MFLIKRAGSADYVKVLDFGMARLRPDLGGGAVATQSGALIGTPAYMSPEQARGDRAGPAADIYALGAVLFHMLTGQMPFQATSLSLMLVAVLQEQPPRADALAKELPPALADLVERALAKDPATRPADMASFRRELLAAAEAAPDGAAVIAESNARASALALEATLAPTVAGSAVGQSSLSAAAGAVEPARAAKRKGVVWIGAAIAAVAIAGVVGVAVLGGGGGGGGATPAAAPSAPPVEAPRAPSLPVAPPPVAPPPVAPPPVAPPPVVETPPVAPPPVAPPPVAPVVAKHPRTPPATAARPPATTPPATTTAPAATPPPITTPPPAEPAKVDRTKQLVGPKPPAQP